MARITCLGREVELLAPAGSPECLHAAVTAGAHAVYLGLGDFNARRRADNFTLENLAESCDYAHLRGARVYLTLNIAILPTEFSRVLDFARDAYLAGVDAFIVQDIGLAVELGKAVPKADLHISTQMNTHNAAGIQAAAMLGAKRVTLARELSIAEVAELADLAHEFDMEVETFAHGALCVCYSGQCLMSSMIGGRSANRGLCAQACRLAYSLHTTESPDALPAEGDHLLSPRDLCTVDMLESLIRAGVSSLKIEGRMKSADYVYAVVSVYRAVLDRMARFCAGDGEAAASAQATDAERSRLSEAFSRGFTTAYLTAQRGNDIMSYGRPNNRGVPAGRVAFARDGVVGVDCSIALNQGDVLEFWTNRGHFAHVIDALEFDAQGRALFQLEQRVGKGDRVFRVRNAEERFADDALEPRIPIEGALELRVGQAANFTVERANPQVGEPIAHTQWGQIVEPARTKPLDEADVRAHIDRLGQTPYELTRLDMRIDPSAGMGFSQLHHLRADALDALTEITLAAYRARSERDCEAFDAPVHKRRPVADACKVVVWASNPGCARAARKAGADEIYVPALNYKRGQSQLEGVVQEADQAGYPKQCVIALPTIDHDPVEGAREYACDFDPWKYAHEDKRVFVDSLGSLVRTVAQGMDAEVGPHLPLLNPQALAVAQRLGAQRVWLSPELTLGQIADLSDASTIELGLTVAGKQELMITEHCALMSQGPCNQDCATCARRRKAHYLKDAKGFDFPVVTDMLGRSHVYNGVMLDIASALPDLLAVGITAVMVDSTLMGEEETARMVRRVVKARDLALASGDAVQKSRGTTTGHLFRGVS